MPGSAGVATAPWRRWGSHLHLIVTDDGATVDFNCLSSTNERKDVTDEAVGPLLTAAVERVNATACRNLTDASIRAANCPTGLNVCKRLTDASVVEAALFSSEATLLTLGPASPAQAASFLARFALFCFRCTPKAHRPHAFVP